MDFLIFLSLHFSFSGRAHTLTFSNKAVICLRDGCYCLLFRVADMRKSQIVAATVRAMMVKNRISKEGELLPLSQVPLEVNAESGDYNIFLVWPVTVVHKIDDKSPLWGVSAEQLISEQFEIIAILEGTIESTGMTTQVTRVVKYCNQRGLIFYSYIFNESVEFK